VRIEEKTIDGLDLELAERQHKTVLGRDREATARTEGELPELGGEHQRDIERPRSTVLIDAMREILDSRGGISEKRSTATALRISQLELPEREAKALEGLQASVTGRTETNQFVFAEDRRELLEQALAVLQPNLTSGSTSELADLRESMAMLTRSVGELREALGDLEDAQEELLGEEKQAYEQAAAPDDKDEKPKPSDPDAPRPATTLTGPERPQPAKPATTLVGPEVKPEPKPASTLSTGPEVTPEPDAPTTLGDEQEISEVAKKKPWWRRPFG
jgi:hypothetical protein